MSIIKNLGIHIDNDKASLSEDVYIYQKDRGIELKLKINQIRTSRHSAIRSSIFDSDNIFASATIMKPNGELIGRRKSIVIDNTITFIIDKELTDQIDEIGIYKIQFHLYDNDDCRITIPPVSFEVKELLGDIDEDNFMHSYGIADDSLVDSCFTIDDSKDLTIFADGKYIKTIWKSGDLIASSKLNKIEEAIETLDERFYIGEEPLDKKPTIWVDITELDVDDTLLNNVSPTSYNLLELSNNSNNFIYDNCKNNLFDILKNMSDKIETLEKEVKLLKNNY